MAALISEKIQFVIILSEIIQFRATADQDTDRSILLFSKLLNRHVKRHITRTHWSGAQVHGTEHLYVACRKL